MATCEALVNSMPKRVKCWKIMVATQNIDTLGPIWTFSLRGVLTFVASGLDINGCVLSYFEGTANLHCYTSCTLTTLHCSKMSFLQCCHMKDIIKYLQKCEGCTHFCEILCIYCMYIYIYIYIYIYMTKCTWRLLFSFIDPSCRLIIRFASQNSLRFNEKWRYTKVEQTQAVNQ